jgi:5-(carboxyamino)imidazole ribonucleotide synthase
MVAELMEDLRIVGVLAVEFFVEKGRLLINEIAPRPHNTGHYTLIASQTSQFENFLRVSLGFPPGSTSLLKPGGMVNLIGSPLREELLGEILSRPTAQLYWYQKEVKPGRKVGHVNFTGETSVWVIEEVISFARRYPPQMGEGSTAGVPLSPAGSSPPS